MFAICSPAYGSFPFLRLFGRSGAAWIILVLVRSNKRSDSPVPVRSLREIVLWLTGQLRSNNCRNQAFALINLLDYPLHHDWLRFDCVYHLHKSRTETTTSEVFRCGIFACSSLFWRWCSLHSESSSWVERCRIFTETIFGHPQPAKNPWKRVRIVSRSTFAGNS